MRGTHTCGLHSRSDARTSLERGYLCARAAVRACARGEGLAPLMATHCVISTSGRVTPRYKTNDKARQIPLRFESLKSSLVLPISRSLTHCATVPLSRPARLPRTRSPVPTLSRSLYPNSPCLSRFAPSPLSFYPPRSPSSFSFCFTLRIPSLRLPPTFYCFNASAYRGYGYV